MFSVKFSEHAIKQIKKLAPSIARMIKHWVLKYLVGTLDPRIHGKMLTGNLSGVWRYRVGDYPNNKMNIKIETDQKILYNGINLA